MSPCWAAIPAPVPQQVGRSDSTFGSFFAQYPDSAVIESTRCWVLCSPVQLIRLIYHTLNVRVALLLRHGITRMTCFFW